MRRVPDFRTVFPHAARRRQRGGYAVITALVLASTLSVVMGLVFRQALQSTQRAERVYESAQRRQLLRAGEIVREFADPPVEPSSGPREVPLPPECGENARLRILPPDEDTNAPRIIAHYRDHKAER